jgi:hypothetical protein
MIEYYYQDQLRWSFGFDNPNKAAVIFACLVPVFVALLLHGIGALATGRRRWPWLLAGLAGLLPVLFCLGKTGSRGGVVAAGIATAWMVFDWWHGQHKSGSLASSRSRFHWLWPLAIGGLGLAMLWMTGILHRIGMAAVSSDASVGNRLVLWKEALAMAFDAPGGVGAGHSGTIYMQWYQPVAMTAAYRTLVNSYLTFLVERGWLIFALAALLAGFLWYWSRLPASAGSGQRTASQGMRGLWLAFAMAGFFSTTMENGWLWLPPGLGLLTVLWLKRQAWRTGARQALVSTLLTMGPALFCLWLAGACLAWRSGWTRQLEFLPNGEVAEVLLLAPDADLQSHQLVVLADPQVLGVHQGKRLRELALAAKRPVRVVLAKSEHEPVAIAQADWVMACGEAAEWALATPPARLIWLSPTTAAIPADADIRSWAMVKHVEVWLPGIDEDGRGPAWKDLAGRQGWKTQELSGVGIQATWAWEQVLAWFRQEKS